MTPEAIVDYWFAGTPEARSARWWKKDPEHDAELERRFGDVHRQAAKGALDHWAETPRGRLGLVLLLDQISRNLHRDRPQAFACDARAQALCLEGISAEHDASLEPMERAFLYMPLVHSEDPALHERALALFAELGDSAPGFLKSAQAHQEIIARFGRYPHRNAVLGRECTPEEEAFLETPGSSF